MQGARASQLSARRFPCVPPLPGFDGSSPEQRARSRHLSGVQSSLGALVDADRWSEAQPEVW